MSDVSVRFDERVWLLILWLNTNSQWLRPSQQVKFADSSRFSACRGDLSCVVHQRLSEESDMPCNTAQSSDKFQEKTISYKCIPWICLDFHPVRLSQSQKISGYVCFTPEKFIQNCKAAKILFVFGAWTSPDVKHSCLSNHDFISF